MRGTGYASKRLSYLGHSFVRHSRTTSIKPTNVPLRRYSDEFSRVEGEAQVTVRHGDKEDVLSFFAVTGVSPTLLGRTWTKALELSVPAL